MAPISFANGKADVGSGGHRQEQAGDQAGDRRSASDLGGSALAISEAVDTGEVGRVELIEADYLHGVFPDMVAALVPTAFRVVYLSADGVRPEMERQISPIHQSHAELERAVQRSGLDWVFLHPASFASNTLSWAPQIREGVVREAFGSRVRALIHEADIAAVAVHALTHDDLLGTRPVLTGPEALTTAEQVTALGMPVRFEEIIGRPPRSIREWALDHADDFR